MTEEMDSRLLSTKFEVNRGNDRERIAYIFFRFIIYTDVHLISDTQLITQEEPLKVTLDYRAEKKGRAFEAFLAGLPIEEIERLSEELRVAKGRKRARFLKTIQDAVRLQRLAGLDPSKPKSKAMKALYNRVSSRLRLAGCKKCLGIFFGFFTSADFYGVDCFFKCGKGIVTIDFFFGTDVVDKKKRTGAEIVLTPRVFLNDEHYQLGDDIANRLLIKIGAG
jgi:hypothetical protein